MTLILLNFSSVQQSPFPFFIYLEMCIPVYNLESDECFQMGICRSLCHSFNFIYMRFVVVKVILIPIKFYKKIYFQGKFVTEFCCSFFYSHVQLPQMNKFLFIEKQFSPQFNKTGKLQFSALHFPKCLCLEFAQYKNPLKECCQNIKSY